MSEFEVYLGSLVPSWEAFEAATPGLAFICDSGYVAAYFTDPVLNNAVVRTPGGVMGAASLYGTRPLIYRPTARTTC